MRNPTYKEKNLAIFHQMQTIIVCAKMTKTETQTNTALKILPPAIMNLIGVYLLLPGKLDHLSALAVFMQEEDGFGSDEIKGINEVLIKASTMSDDKQQTIDKIYNTNFTSIIELIGNRKEALLRKAAKAGNEFAVVQLLKNDGIDVNAKDNYGKTGLMLAASNGHTSVVTQLLSVKDIAVNAIDFIGMTALMWAANFQHTSVVTELLNADGILVNAKGNDGMTALMLAAGNEHTSVVTQLLSVKDIAVNAIDFIGMTALMWAARHRRTSIVHQLCMKQLFDGPLNDGDSLFEKLTNEIKSGNSSMTINPESLYAYFLECVDALPAADKRISLLEKALSGMNSFSALMQNEQRLQIEEVLTKLKSSQEAQSSNNTQPVIFSDSAGAPSSSSNTAHASLRLISNQ